MSAPFPACSSTSPMMIKLTKTWMMTTKVNMPRSLLCRAALGGRLPGDGDEAWCLQGGAADEGAVDVGLLSEGGRIVGLHAAAVEDPKRLRDFLGGELGDEPAEIA